MTRRPSRLAHGGIARVLSARSRAVAGDDANPADLSSRLRGVFEQFANAVGALAESDSGSLSNQGEMPVEIGGRTARMVFGYTLRMGLDGLRAEPFGDAPPPGPRAASVDAAKSAGPALRAPITDLFEEGDMLRVIAELPGVAADDITCTLDGATLRIETGGAQRYGKTIKLPYAVDPASMSRGCRNGILEVSLRRATAP